MNSIYKKPNAIFFDLDGTLIDSAPDLGQAADKMRTDRGLSSLDASLYRPMAGAGARGMLKVAFDMAPDHADFLTYREEFFTNYANSLTNQTYAFNGIHAILRELERQSILWGIVTNKSKRFTEPLMVQMSVLHGATAVVSGDTTPHAKPHPAPLLEACRLAQVAPRDCWYLGDDKRDIDAGRAAGMTTLAVTWGYEGEHSLDTWQADHVLHHPQDLIALLSTK